MHDNMYQVTFFPLTILSPGLSLLFCLTSTDLSGHDNDTETLSEPLTGCPCLSWSLQYVNIRTSINGLRIFGSSAAWHTTAGGPYVHSFSLQRHNICSMMRLSRETPCHKPCLSCYSFCFLNSSIQLHLISVCLQIWRSTQQTHSILQAKQVQLTLGICMCLW